MPICGHRPAFQSRLNKRHRAKKWYTIFAMIYPTNCTGTFSPNVLYEDRSSSRMTSSEDLLIQQRGDHSKCLGLHRGWKVCSHYRTKKVRFGSFVERKKKSELWFL